MPTTYHHTLAAATLAAKPEANGFLIGLYGDDPGTEEMAGAAYVDGADPTVATHAVSSGTNTTSEKNAIIAYFSTTPGCTGYSQLRVSGQTFDAWGRAFELWGLKPVSP